MEDYRAAAIRHHSDAEHLLTSKRLENADHHYGIAAECALKAAWKREGRPVTTEPPHVHIDKLWSQAALHFSGRHNVALVNTIKRSGDPFADWSVSQRYHASGLLAMPEIETHRRACRRLLGAVGILGHEG